jgi:hypothetical protein
MTAPTCVLVTTRPGRPAPRPPAPHVRAGDLVPAGLVVALSVAHDDGVTDSAVAGWLLLGGLGVVALAVVAYLDRLRD